MIRPGFKNLSHSKFPKEQILGYWTLILIRQYRSILIPNSDAQKETALTRLSSAPPASKTVVLEDGGMFTVAEQKHQKNRMRRDPAMLRCLVESGQGDLSSSYLATRLNGWGGSSQNWTLCLVQVSRWKRHDGTIQQGVEGSWPE